MSSNCAEAETACSACAGADFWVDLASKTSAWIILPLGPVPLMPDKSTFDSWAVFFAKGEAMTLPSKIIEMII